MTDDLCEFPVLLYCADFPPSSRGGGTIIMSRLLAEYPTDKLLVLVNSHEMKISPKKGRLSCRHLIFQATNKTGPLGLGRVKVLVDYLALPLLCLLALWVMHRRKVQVILSVAHGHFFLAAAFISQLTGKPLVLAIHDDWVDMSWRGFIPLRKPYKWMFHWALKKAAHIYVISPSMQEILKRDYGVIAEFQASGILGLAETISSFPRFFNESCPHILYAGSLLWSSIDGLELLMTALQKGLLKKRGVGDWQVDLYTNDTAADIRKRYPWLDDPQIRIHPWAEQDQLPGILAAADILFLPMSFDKRMGAMIRTSLPTKTADYLLSNRPIFVLAPPYSGLSRYAKDCGFAEVVEQPIPEVIADGIARIVRSEDYRKKLTYLARRTLKLNHNLQSQRESFYRRISYLATRIR